jgi:PhnB protein
MTSIAAWIAVSNAHDAVEFYKAAFGATERYRAQDDDGTVIVAHLAIDEADFWVQDEPGSSPPSGGGPVRMIVTVDDPRSVFAQALAAGATEIGPVTEGHGWLVGRLEDPFGHHWEVGKPLPGGPA